MTAPLASADGADGRPSRDDLARYFAWLGATGFGGPVALVGYMQRDLVDRRRWFSESEFADAVALAQLSPGPLAAQVAMYLGWLRGGAIGASLVGTAFVAPPFLMVLALSALYTRTGSLPWLERAFLGVGAGVIAILARSTWKLARLTLRADRMLWAIALLNAIVVAVTRKEWIALLLLAGCVRIVPRLVRSASSAALIPIAWSGALAGLLGASLSIQLFAFFAQAGAAVFGSGLAILPYLYAGCVEQRHWLTDRQFLDAVAVSMITPGPVVITAAFIGYLVHGTVGAGAAALGVFAPCWLFVIAFAPRFSSIVRNPNVRLFVGGVTAAATGALAGAAGLLAARVIVDATTAVIAALVFVLLVARVRLPEPLFILAAGIAGVLLKR